MGETGVVKIDRYGDRSNIELDIQKIVEAVIAVSIAGEDGHGRRAPKTSALAEEVVVREAEAAADVLVADRKDRRVARGRADDDARLAPVGVDGLVDGLGAQHRRRVRVLARAPRTLHCRFYIPRLYGRVLHPENDFFALGFDVFVFLTDSLIEVFLVKILLNI